MSLLSAPTWARSAAACRALSKAWRQRAARLASAWVTAMSSTNMAVRLATQPCHAAMTGPRWAQRLKKLDKSSQREGSTPACSREARHAPSTTCTCEGGGKEERGARHRVKRMCTSGVTRYARVSVSLFVHAVNAALSVAFFKCDSACCTCVVCVCVVYASHHPEREGVAVSVARVADRRTQ